MTAYENLANAVVLLAVEDYRKLLKKLSRHPERRSAMAAVNESEKFFKSEYFKVLTTVDGETLLRKLKEETFL